MTLYCVDAFILFFFAFSAIIFSLKLPFHLHNCLIYHQTVHFTDNNFCMMIIFLLLWYVQSERWTKEISIETHPLSLVYMIDSDQHPVSNRHPLTSLSQITVQFRNIFKSPLEIIRPMADLLVSVRSYLSDVIGRKFEKVRNCHRFENWIPIWEFEKRT